MGKFLTKAGGPLFDPLRDNATKKGGPLYTGAGGPLYDPVRDAILKKDGGGSGGYVGTPPPVAPAPGGVGYGTPGWTPMANSGVPTGQQQAIPITPQGQPMSGSPMPQQGTPMASTMAQMASGGRMDMPPGMAGMSPGMIAAAMSILGQNMGSIRPQDQI